VPVAFYWYWLRRDWWFLDPINTFWPIYVMFGVLESATGLEDWRDIYGASRVDHVLLLYFVAGLCVCFGYGRPMGTSLGRRLPVAKGVDEPHRFLLLGYATLALGLLAQIYIIQDAGGMQQFLSVARGSVDYSRINIFTLTLIGFMPVGLLIILCTAYVDRRYVFLRRAALAATAVYGAWSVYAGTRSGLILTATILFGAVYGAGRRNPSGLVIAGALALTVVGVGFTTVSRGSFVGGSYNREFTATGALAESLSWYKGGEEGGVVLGSEFGMSMAAVRYVGDEVPYDRGYMMLELFTRQIPRAIWPDKIYPEGKAWDTLHRAAGTARSLNAAGYLSGPAPGLIGKWYYMFGVPGVILGSMWTGIFLRMLQAYVRRYKGASGAILAVGFFMFGFSEMNNPFGWVFGWLPTTGIGVFLVVLLGRKGAITPWVAVAQDGLPDGESQVGAG
jgi:hypothetical protein